MVRIVLACAYPTQNIKYWLTHPNKRRAPIRLDGHLDEHDDIEANDIVQTEVGPDCVMQKIDGEITRVVSTDQEPHPFVKTLNCL